MSLLAVSVAGPDRPGIVAELAGRLAALGGNLEDTTMSLLRGHVAMTVLVRSDAAPAAVEAALAPLTADGSLMVTVRAVGDDPAGAASTGSYVLSVHGADQPGIVAAVTAVVARRDGNLTDLTTRLTGPLYLLVAELTLPDGSDVEGLRRDLHEMAQTLGVEVTLRAAGAP